MKTGSHILIRSLDRGATIFLIVVAAIAIVVPILNLAVPESSVFHLPTYLVALFGKYACYALLALSIDLIWGYCGILSLGHGAFMAIGAYTAALLSVKMGLPFVWAVLAGGCLAGMVGIVVGLPALRIRGVYLMLMTLGFG